LRDALDALALYLVGAIAIAAMFFLVATFQSWPAEAKGHNASVFCDRVTATGGMNCGAMVFAHRTLPLGSVHRITCNGRVISARVVDRGPARWTGRDYDLSPGLARACGISGLGNVRVI